MFNNKRKETIILTLIDPQENDNGLAILKQDAILSVFYNHQFNQLVINVKQTRLDIGSRLMVAEELLPRTSNGQLVKEMGRVVTAPTGKYRNDIYLNGSGGNEQIVLNSDEEIKRFLNWWDEDIDTEILFSKHRAHVQKMEEAKKEAELRREAELKQAEEEVKKKLEATGGKLGSQLRRVSDEVPATDQEPTEQGFEPPLSSLNESEDPK